MKELKSLDRNIDRDRYVRIDKLDVDDALNNGYAYIILKKRQEIFRGDTSGGTEKRLRYCVIQEMD